MSETDYIRWYEQLQSIVFVVGLSLNTETKLSESVPVFERFEKYPFDSDEKYLKGISKIQDQIEDSEFLFELRLKYYDKYL